MGVRYTVKGADFSGLRPINHVPEEMGFTGWFWHGQSLEKSCLNYASPNVPAVVEGPAGPVIAKSFMQTRNTLGWLNSRVAETQAFSFYCLARIPVWNNESAPTLIASLTGTAVADGAGAALDFSNNGPRVGGFFTDAGSPSFKSRGGAAVWDGTTTEAEWIKKWAFYAGVCEIGSTSSILRFYNKTHQDTASGTFSTVARLLSSNTLRIGGVPSTGRYLAADIAFTAIANTPHSADQVDAIYRQVRGAASRRGINC